jgi:hypothetical protein
MKKRLFWAAAGLSASALLSFAVFPHWPSYALDYFQNKPFFKGKPPSHWSRVIGSSNIEFAPEAASELRAGGAQAVPVLIELLHDDELSVKAKAAQILGSLGRSSANAIPALKKAAAEPNWTASQAATKALTQIELEMVEWQQFVPMEGGFSILMPGKPEEIKTPVLLPEGEAMVFNYLVQVHNTVFTVGYSVHPEEASQKLTDDERVDHACENMLTVRSGQVVYQKPIVLEKYVGRERLYVYGGESAYRVRAYWVKPRLYQVIVTGPRETMKSPQAEKFLDSLRVLKE